MRKICSIGQCLTEVKSRSYCAKHYARFLRHGDPEKTLRVITRSREDAFSARTTREGDCLVWVGATNGQGYGKMTGSKDTPAMQYAHRYAWERVHGEIPKGLVIDHKCHNPACVEVGHLRAITQQQNTENRGKATSSTGIRNVYKAKRDGTYRVILKIDGKTRQFGVFDSLEKAKEVAQEMRHLYLPYSII